MPIPSTAHTSTFKIRSYEVGADARVTLPSIANYLQESAGLHAKKLNFDISQLNQKGLTWVLFKMNIIINHYPERWAKLAVNTWPSNGDGIRAFRDYRIYNSSNQLICKAISQWMVLDIKKGRPARLPDELMRFPKTARHAELDYSKKSLKNPAAETGSRQFVSKVGLHHLDMNNHVNNVHYIEWLTGYYQPFPNQPREISLQYIKEAKAGDEIYLSVFEDTGRQEIFSTLTNQHHEQLAIAKICF